MPRAKPQQPVVEVFPPAQPGVPPAYATAIFEDMYPGKVDADYNDVVVKFHIQRKFVDGKLHEVKLTLVPRPMSATYKNKLSLVLDGDPDAIRRGSALIKSEPMFEGAGDVTVRYFSADGQLQAKKTRRQSSDRDVVLYQDLTQLKDCNLLRNRNAKCGEKVEVVVKVRSPERNEFAEGFAAAKCRLLVSSARSNGRVVDIDLIQVDREKFDTQTGFPYAILVPGDFAYPAPGQRITELYPEFAAWKDQVIAGQVNIDDFSWFQKPSAVPPAVRLIDHDGIGTPSIDNHLD